MPTLRPLPLLCIRCHFSASAAGYDLTKMTMKELVDKYGLDKDTAEFVG